MVFGCGQFCLHYYCIKCIFPCSFGNKHNYVLINLCARYTEYIPSLSCVEVGDVEGVDEELPGPLCGGDIAPADRCMSYMCVKL